MIPDETTIHCSRCSAYNIGDDCCICQDCINKIFEDLDLELMFTDIKNKEGNKIPESDDLMKLLDIFWKHISVNLKSKLTQLTGGQDGK